MKKTLIPKLIFGYVLFAIEATKNRMDMALSKTMRYN